MSRYARLFTGATIAAVVAWLVVSCVASAVHAAPRPAPEQLLVPRPAQRAAPSDAPPAASLSAPVRPVERPRSAAGTESGTPGHYGPWTRTWASFFDWQSWGTGTYRGFVGRGHHSFACGGAYQRMTLGIAHRWLPCGQLVELRHGSLTVTVPVVDRFFGAGVDMTSQTCYAIRACHTGVVEMRTVNP